MTVSTLLGTELRILIKKNWLSLNLGLKLAIDTFNMGNKKVELSTISLLLKNLQFLPNFMTLFEMITLGIGNIAWIWALLDQNYKLFANSQLFGFSTYSLHILYLL